MSDVIQKHGRWCAAHVNVAWKIHQHKVNKAFDPASSLRAGRDASKLSNSGLLSQAQLLGMSANSATGLADVHSNLHPQGQSTSVMVKLVGWLSGRTSVSDRQTFTGLHRTCS